MRIPYYYLIAVTNLLRRKRIFKYNVLLITLALTIIYLTNTLTMSLWGFIDKFLYNSIEFRTLLLDGYKYDTQYKSKIEGAIKGDQRIIEFNHELFGVRTELVNARTYFENNELQLSDSFGNVSLQAAMIHDKAFLISGRFINENESNVGIIPKKFYPDGSFQIEYLKNNVDFIDGDSLIGKTITVNYYAYKNEKLGMKKIKTFSYSFKVVGTYDIIPNNYYPYHILIPYNDLKLIIENMDNNNIGFSETYNVTYNILVDDQKNVEAVINKLGSLGIKAMRKSYLGTIGDLSKYIIIIGHILGYLVLFISIINIALTMADSIKKRTGEIGLMKAMGYYDRQVSLIVIMEALIIGVISLLLTLSIWLIFMILLKYIITNYASIYMQGINVKWDVISFLQITALSILAPVLGSFWGVRNITRINPKVALNKGC